LNGGLGSSDDPQSIIKNRARMAHALGVNEHHLLSLYQIHSATCVKVNEPWSLDQRPRADAMVTNQTGLALGIGTADCGPLLFADPHARVIGAAHAGWKGALYGVIESTILAMEELGAQRGRLHVTLGPTISQSAYEVGPEFRETFLSTDKNWDRFFTAQNESGKCHFDLPAFIMDRLEKAHVGSIENLALCTYADEQRFFSFRRTTHRKEADYGRLIAAIALTE
jgi:YfiH family protein